MGEATSDGDADAFLAAFLQLRLADRQRGVEPSLADYCARFPGRDELIRAAWGETTASAQLGHYRLLASLGRGGQGEVWLAEDPRLGRKVAIKVLHGIALASREGLERFRREAATASRIDHPGICPVYDVGMAGGAPFLVMRCVEGEPLATAVASLRGDGASVRRIAAIGERLARALHAAHEAGVLHRDVKPQNVLLSRDDQPVLLDFGLARLVEDDTLFTRTGDVFGTPAYLAPELLATPPAPPDRRADVYGLGVTLYECLCGARPFAAPTRAALYQQILAGTPAPIRRLNPAVPRDLAIVVQTAIAGDPRRRYASAGALADDLQRWLAHRPILAREPGLGLRLQRWYQRGPAFALALLGLICALAFGFGVSLHWWRAAEGEQQRSQTLLREWESLADGRRLEELMAVADTELWPAVPAKIGAMDAWLVDADALVARLPGHRAALAELARATEAAVGERSVAAVENAWRHHQLELLVGGLEAFAADDAFATTVASVRSRRAWASSVYERCVVAAQGAWDAAADRVRRAPLYGGLALTPQLGLVPLGPDPDSGLEEFADLATGALPERDRNGHLRCGEATGVVFVLVPAGSFAMGAQKNDPDGANYDAEAKLIEGPVNRVTLAAYLLSKFELTQGQWLRVLGDNPSDVAPGRRDRDELVDLRHPVESVSWSRCATFLLHLGMAFPSEAQWEYACRAGGSAPWSSGVDYQALAKFANLADEASRAAYPGDWPYERWDDGHTLHAAVGAYLPNAFGLYDMHGNVSEWCEESVVRYDHPVDVGTGIRRAPATNPPSDPSLAPLRCYRGGNYLATARLCRSARREQDRVVAYLQSLGLRPARRLE